MRLLRRSVYFTLINIFIYIHITNVRLRNNKRQGSPVQPITFNLPDPIYKFNARAVLSDLMRALEADKHQTSRSIIIQTPSSLPKQTLVLTHGERTAPEAAAAATSPRFISGPACRVRLPIVRICGLISFLFRARTRSDLARSSAPRLTFYNHYYYYNCRSSSHRST